MIQIKPTRASSATCCRGAPSRPPGQLPEAPEDASPASPHPQRHGGSPLPRRAQPAARRRAAGGSPLSRHAKPAARRPPARRTQLAARLPNTPRRQGRPRHQQREPARGNRSARPRPPNHTCTAWARPLNRRRSPGCVSLSRAARPSPLPQSTRPRPPHGRPTPAGPPPPLAGPPPLTLAAPRARVWSSSAS